MSNDRAVSEHYLHGDLLKAIEAATQIDGVTSPTSSLAAHRAITQIVWIGMSRLKLKLD